MFNIMSSSQISLDTFWETKGEIKKDRFNNDIMPTFSSIQMEFRLL